jgi:membrane protein YdbS with pleckstrin-like domain
MVSSTQQVDRRVVALWRLQRTVRLCLFVTPLGLIGGFLVGQNTSATLGMLFGVAFISFHALMVLVWPPLEYRNLRYTVREEDLMVESGVLFHRWSCIPFTRIQHVDTRQGPMERLFGLQRLAVYTAAGMHADGSIPGLHTDVAAALRDDLSRRGGDDGV